jgi:hypothetical protein
MVERGWTPEAIGKATILQLICAATETPPGESGPKKTFDEMKAALDAIAAAEADWSRRP